HDGKLVAVGGQNRVIYLVDADTLQVKRRLYFGVRIGELHFTRDGKKLLVEDETDTLSLLDLATGKVAARLSNVNGLTVHPGTNQLVVRDLSEVVKGRLLVLSPDDLKARGQVELPDRPVAWAFVSGGKGLVVLGTSKYEGKERPLPLKVPDA